MYYTKVLFLIFVLVTQARVFGGPRSRQLALDDSQEPVAAQLWQLLSKQPSNTSFPDLQKRQSATTTTNCGYLNGDVALSRTAAAGWNCRFDTVHALWGFCPATVSAATDCGLAGNCVDSQFCTNGCGITGTSGITTFTCGSSAFCSTALLTEGPDQVFSYIACGAVATVEHLLASPTFTSTTKTSSTSSTRAAVASTSSTIASSTTTSTTSKSTSESSSGSITSNPLTTSVPLTQTPNLQSSSTSTSQAPLSSLASSSTTSSTTGTSGNNLGPIIGGVIGGLAIICAFVLGILYLRRDQQKKMVEGSGEKRKSQWWKPYRTTEMQTAGLHEVEGNGTMVHEADGSWSGYGYGELKPGKSPAYELGS